jgi:hypothetical protein
MKAVRGLLVALALVAVAACGDRSPTALPPVPGPDASLLGSLLKPTGLLSCSALPYASATQTIGSAGGSIRVGPHTLVVPPGALSAPVAITGELRTGTSVNAVRFQPAGLQFRTHASLTMSYANCNLLGLLLPKRIAYTINGLQILQYLLSFDNLFANKVTGRVNHFSDYAIAW